MSDTPKLEKVVSTRVNDLMKKQYDGLAGIQRHEAQAVIRKALAQYLHSLRFNEKEWLGDED
jgi:predicted transcriptional regulator